MDRYDPDRDLTPAFMAKVIGWIEASGEVLVVLRYLRAAGSKDVAFCRTAAEFHRLIEVVSMGTDIIVFRQRQLGLRGIVDDTLIESACSFLAEGAEYLVASLDRETASPLSTRWGMGDSHEDLLAFLKESRGEKVAIGSCPDFNSPDNDDMVSASKGGIDGPR